MILCLPDEPVDELGVWRVGLVATAGPGSRHQLVVVAPSFL
jgi:hypothetical protein